ncbi:hypothetical protein CVO_00485 [Sulfurimonas sp. CVO]|uniref:hypothetical protein n=1 Tax=Sulfurimonas sp. CVO TaxID=2283483 RepID=UPI00132EFC5A|nr:hypothetical protein [Sulfurimonas sp. CVO]QHG90402.1 hypothetical protein CVO_00485 [Sulfurimonas sp. CVO]
MENIPNVNQIIIEEIRDLRKVVETAMLCKCNKVDLTDEFNIKGQKKAAKLLDISVETLQDRLKEGKRLKENMHYRVKIRESGRKRYFFNQSALLSVKGLI